MAKRLLSYAPEMNSLGRKLCVVISALALITFAYTANAAPSLEQMRQESADCFATVARAISYYQPQQNRNLRKGDQLFKSPLPKVQDGPSVNNPWDPKFKSNRYMAHHVYYDTCTCWLNIAVARAKELSGRDVKVYYDASSVFVVHFRNPREAQAALNILLQGENVELPPYWVEKEV